ncbi:unnamed protein product, partial [Scytosiphon promiscuus]
AEGEEGEEWRRDVPQHSRRNSNEGRAVVRGLSESSVGHGSSAMIGSYPDVTAGGDSSGDVGAVGPVDDGDGDGDSDDLDMATLLRMQAEIEATRQQADDAEEKVASMSGTILALTPLM